MNEKTEEFSIQTLTIKVGVVSSDVAEIKTTVRDLSQTLGRIVVMEERQMQLNHTVERAFKEIEKIDRRVDSLEQQAPLNKQATNWAEKAVTGAFGIAVLVLLAKLGIK